MASKKAASQVEQDTTEIYLFMGGRRLDAYTILRPKIQGLSPVIDTLNAFQHQFSSIIYLTSKANPSFKGEFYRVYNNYPLVLTSVSGGEDFGNLPSQLEMKLSVASEKSIPIA